MHATVLLRALGYSTQDLLNYFYSTETVFLEKGGQVLEEHRVRHPRRPARDARHQDRRRGHRQEEHQVHQAPPSGSCRRRSSSACPSSRRSSSARSPRTTSSTRRPARSSSRCNEELTEAKLERLREAGIEQFTVLFIDGLNVGAYLRDTLLADKVKTTEDAIMEIYRRLRPGDPPTLETAKTLFNNLFFNPERYDLSKVGRLKLNYKFYRDVARGSSSPRSISRCSRRRTSSRRCATSSSSRTAAARSTTSTTSATAACARSAS